MPSFSSESIAASARARACACVCVRACVCEREYIFYAMLNAQLDVLKVAEVA